MAKKLCIAFLWLAQLFFVNAWTVTSYMQVSFQTDAAGTSTKTIYIVPASPIPSALSTNTKGQGYLITIVELLLSPNAKTIDPIPTPSLTTRFYVPVTFTPPPSPRCNTTWTYTSTVSIDPPLAVQAALKPWSISTSATTETYPYYAHSTQTTSRTTVFAILNPTDVPDSMYASASLSALPDVITSCTCRYIEKITTLVYPTGPNRTVTATATSTPTNGVSEYGITCGYFNPYCMNCEKVKQYCKHNCPSGGRGGGHKTYPLTGEYLHCEDADYWIWGSDTYHNKNLERAKIAVPVSWCGFFFLLGLLENWFGFSRIMEGGSAALGAPQVWAFGTLGISLLFLGPAWAERNGHDQVVLRTKWREVGRWRKVKLYARYAWRWKYPAEELGKEPRVVRVSIYKRIKWRIFKRY